MGSDVRRAAVLGHPIGHSKSPALHRAAYASLGLRWTYDAIDIDEQQLPGFIGNLDDTWAGLSLTMPLKEAILPLLSEISEEARLLRSVNTVLPGRTPGTWRGVNTDVEGIVQAVRRASSTPVGSRAVILGSGATARSAVAALAQLGITSLVVCARNEAASQGVAQVAAAYGLDVQTFDGRPDPDRVKTDLLSSTLPGEAARPWVSACDSATGILLDVSYHPWPSVLAASWGGRVAVSGLDMLLWQAVAQVTLMTGLVPDAEAMRRALVGR